MKCIVSMVSSLRKLIPTRGINASLSLAVIALLMTLGAQAAAPQIGKSDLAIILPMQKDFRIAALDIAAPGIDAFLPSFLLKQVEESYRSTSIGDALETENSHSDWTLVSLRVAPCSPMGIIPGPETNILCWPEVRLVWQPIIQNFRRYAVILKWFADDRAIHTLYDVSPSIGLSNEEASRAQKLLNKIRSALEERPTAAASLVSSDELIEFIKLRDRVSDSLMQKAIGLRSTQITSDQYSRLEERPEFKSPDESAKFISRLKTFLSQTANYSALKEMTSFSLPEGREPPQLDEWVFLKYLKNNGRMEQVDITVVSAVDGRTLLNMGKAPRASQMRDDPSLHDQLDIMKSLDADELKKRVLLSVPEVTTKQNIINDRNLSLVPNTTCGSCHKFNNLRFDFHNLSYLEDRDVTISPRVKFDLMRDLQWLEQRNKR